MEKGSKLILVVCRGNIARSPVAEFVLNVEVKKNLLDSKIKVISRGVQGTRVDPESVKFPNISFYKDFYAEAKPALDKLNIDISKHVSKPVTEKDFKNADIVLAVDIKTKEALSELFPDSKEKLHLLSELVNREDSFTDPENLKGTEKYYQVFKEIKETVEKGFPKLMELLKA